MPHSNGSRTSGNQEGISMSVVVSFHLDKFVTARITSRYADRRHSRFRTGVDHSYFLDRRDHTHDQLCDLHFLGSGCSERSAVFHGLDHGLSDHRMVVAQDHRSPTIDQFDKGVTVLIVDESPLGFLDKDWLSAHCTKCTNWGVHSTRDEVFCMGKKPFAFRNLHDLS